MPEIRCLYTNCPLQVAGPTLVLVTSDDRTAALARGSIHVAVGKDATEIVQSVLSVSPRGLMTDIDGTISRIAGHPDEAVIDPAARSALDTLTEALDLVAAISGRSALDARSIVGLDRLVYSGNHGMEIWRDGRLEQSEAASGFVERIEDALDSLRGEISIPGVYFENKVLTGSVHVRGTEDPELAEQVVFEKLEALAGERGLRVTRGRMVIEIRPPVDLNKGSSVTEMISRYALSGAIYLGDDVTDVDAFLAMQRLRHESGEPYFSLGVAGPETPPTVLEHADALVEGVDGVVEFLEFVIERSSSEA